MPPFVLTNNNKKKKRNRWIKSFNYPRERKTIIVCVRVCVCDTILPALYQGREVVATVTAVGAWRKWEGGSREQTVGERKESASEMEEIQTFNCTLYYSYMMSGAHRVQSFSVNSGADVG